MSLETLRTLVPLAALRHRAGDAVFARGVAYYHQERVSELVVADNQVAARVDGTEPYRVRLWDSGDGLEWDCTCPQGVDLHFCKHCVAVALAWNPPPEDASAAPSPDDVPMVARAGSRFDGDSGGDGRERVRSYLDALTQRELVALVMDEARRNPRLRRHLLLRVASRSGAVDVSRFRKAVDAVFRGHGRSEYGYGAPSADRILEMVDELRTLLDADPDALIGLVEHAVALAEVAVNEIDHDDEDFPAVFDALGELHLEACTRARPDSVALAERLFELEMTSEYVFYQVVGAYADVLGVEGMKAYRARVRKAWDRVRPLGPGERDDGDGRSRITGLMEALARAEGDLEARVEVRRRDLSSSYHFLQIAELYRDAGEAAKAVEWAQAGLDAFPGSPDARLRRFLADEHLRAGRHADALELAWAEFAEHPELERYRRLMGFADAAGGRPGCRERALAFAREHADAARREHERVRAWGPSAGYTSIVRMLLWDDDVDGAWAAAQQGGCSDDVWFQLARRRQETHPADAIPIYQRRIEAEVQHGSGGYEDPVRVLVALQRLYARAGESAEAFAQYVARLRTTYKRRRNFIKLLDQANLGRPVAAGPETRSDAPPPELGPLV
jgi:uncharacterized Zn finger protein